MDFLYNVFESIMKCTCYSFSLLVVFLLILLYIHQTKLIYIPNPPTPIEPIPLEYQGETSKDAKSIYITTEDGEKLHGWIFLQKDATNFPTILFFHGNALTMYYHFDTILQFYYNRICNVCLIDYRGFGRSTGTPNEKGMKKDATAALDYLLHLKEIDTQKILLMGHSIGGAVALHLAKDCGQLVKGLIIQNAFINLKLIVYRVIPIIGRLLALLLTEKWDNDKAIQNVEIPTLFISSEKDELIPSSHMEELFNLATMKKKIFVSIQDAGHNNPHTSMKHFEEICKFIKQVTEPTENQTDKVMESYGDIKVEGLRNRPAARTDL